MTFRDSIHAAPILAVLAALPLTAAQAGPAASKPPTPVATGSVATGVPIPVAAAGAPAIATGAPAAAARAPAETAAIGAEADRLLKEMSDYIGGAKEFTFRAEITFDHVLASGQKVQYSAREDIAFERPGRLAIDYRGELGDRRFWYDGHTVTLYDPSTPFYATEPAPPDIDATLQKISSELNFLPPLSDLFYRDPYQVLRDNIRTGVVLGANEVNGQLCRHLAFVDNHVDWQVWVADGAQPTPCKVAIDYRTLPGRPQFSAVFSDWNFAPRIAPPVFTAEIPPDAKRIPFLKISVAGSGK